jgi:hypothetical protein
VILPLSRRVFLLLTDMVLLTRAEDAGCVYSTISNEPPPRRPMIEPLALLGSPPFAAVRGHDGGKVVGNAPP